MDYLPVSSNGRRYGLFRDNPELPAKKLLALHVKHDIVLPRSSNLALWMGPIRDQGQEGSCHDEKTEILTDQGWKLFSALDGSEKLATVDPKSAELTYESPRRLIRMYYSGEMYCVSNRSINFCVTPDHQMLARKWDEGKRALSDEYSLVAMKDIGWYAGMMNRVEWKGEGAEEFMLPGVPHKYARYRQPRAIPMSIWMKFLGIYLAEGTMLKREQRRGELNYKIQIAATKEREKSFVREVLSGMDVHYLELGDRFTFHNAQIYEALSQMTLEGVKAGNKFVPKMVFRQSAKHIRDFLSGHMAGDGCSLYGHESHYTSSPQLADGLQLLVFLSGQESRVWVRAARTAMMADGRQVVGSLPEHRVSVCRSKGLSIERKESVRKVQYDGYVYCAEVPTHHTLVTRREGKILISGNCTGQMGAEIRDLLYRKYYLFEKNKKATPASFESSASFVYKCNLIADGDLGVDAGSTIHQTIVTLNRKGTCLNIHEPYNDHDYSTSPTAEQYTDALLYKAGAYHSLPTLLEMRSCIASGYSFGFGIMVYESFENDWKKPGFMPMPDPHKEHLQGGHAQHCFTGNTQIPLLDGSVLSLRELSERFSDQKFWVYSCDALGNIVPGQAHSPRKTGLKQKVIKLTLDNKETITCTPNHQFLLRDGSYRSASELTIKDSLMPLYRKTSTGELVGYDMVLNPASDRWQYTHRLVHSSINGRYGNGVIHHVDFNKLNNFPENLQRMSWEKHTELHAKQAQLLHSYAKSPEGREKSRSAMKALWGNAEWRERALKRASENGSKTSAKLLAEGRHGYQAADKEALRKFGRSTGLKYGKNLQSPEIKKKSKDGFRRFIADHPEYLEALKTRSLLASQKARLLPITDRQREARRVNMRKLSGNLEARKLAQLKTTYIRFHKGKFQSFELFLEHRESNKDAPFNHKIISIEDAGIEDVYDLTVDEHHNFALNAGVFVHNCIGYDDDLEFPDGSHGGLLVQNSWGGSFGISAPGRTDGGCYWMPYAFVDAGLANDAWVIHLGKSWG